jgi:outer membrane lipoprotein-sorting protein
MTPFLRFVTLASSAFVLTVAAQAQTAIVTKARAYLGTEAALDAVKTVHYSGRMAAPDATDMKKQTEASLEIVFQKPDRHRITITSDKNIAITALDGYEGWQRVQDVKDPNKWSQTLASVDQVKRIRANTWENVSFFRGIETRGGRIEVMTPAPIDGVMCNKVAFIYSPSVIFYRYFNQETGKLVMTETEAGSTIREEGEIIVDGIRFPKRIITVTKNPPGKAGTPPTSTITVTFDQVKLNETFPDSYFAVPGLSRK